MSESDSVLFNVDINNYNEYSHNEIQRLKDEAGVN